MIEALLTAQAVLLWVAVFAIIARVRVIMMATADALGAMREQIEREALTRMQADATIAARLPSEP